MARRKAKRVFHLLFLVLFAAILWTFFQPAFSIKLSAFPARSWSAWQLSETAAAHASKVFSPQKKPLLDADLRTGFTDLLQKLFPRKKSQWNWKASAGYALGILIPCMLAAAYFFLLLAALSFGFLRRQGLVRLSGMATGASAYALTGVLYLSERAQDLLQASASEAAHGLVGFLARPLTPQLALEAGTGLILLPLLAGGLWFLGFAAKR